MILRVTLLACALLALAASARADEGTTQLLAGKHTSGVPTPGYLDWLGTTGIDGRGVRIAVVDSGVDRSHPDLDDRVVAEINYDEVPHPPGGDIDELGHGTHVAGIVAGSPDVGALTALQDLDGFLYGMGVAPAAELVAINGLGMQQTAGLLELTELIPSFARDAVRAGAVAWNASWTTGEGAGAGYTASTRTVDSLVRDADPETPGDQPLAMVFSAGNSGSEEHTLTSPHEGKNLIVVASSEGQRAGDTSRISSFSSRGPAMDGRVVPTVAAPGGVISSARSKGSFGGLCFEPAEVSPLHSTCSGTSMAAPHVAGAVALVTQWWRGFHGGANPSPAMLKALLVNTATDLAERDVPNVNEGWGRVDTGALFGVPATARVYADQQQALKTPAETHTLRLVPIDPAQPLRVTVAWTDLPGPAIPDDPTDEDKQKPVLVNDLDVALTTAGGTTYVGNNFDAGRSVPGGEPNRLDNLENIWLDNAPEAGYTLTVRGNALAAPQDYALVVSNARVVTPPSPKAVPLARARWGRKGRRTVLKRLVVPAVPAGATLVLRCRGDGCPRRSYRRDFTAAATGVDLTGRLRRARLRRGARVTLRLLVPGAAPRAMTWTMTRRPGRPKR